MQTSLLLIEIKPDAANVKNAVKTCKAVHPKVVRKSELIYQVTSRTAGTVYTVVFALPANGKLLASCECKAGQNGNLCYHVIAAASVEPRMTSTVKNQPTPLFFAGRFEQLARATKPTAQVSGVLQRGYHGKEKREFYYGIEI